MVTGLCPIHLAVLANQLSSLRELLEGGANVESKERSCGRTPLHLATETDNVSLAGCLLLEVLYWVYWDRVGQRWVFCPSEVPDVLMLGLR